MTTISDDYLTRRLACHRAPCSVGVIRVLDELQNGNFRLFYETFAKFTKNAALDSERQLALGNYHIRFAQ